MMNDETQAHIDFIEGVMAEEKDKVRKDANGHTWRYKMAEGMKQAIEHKEYKKQLRADAQERQFHEREVIRLKEHWEETQRRARLAERIIEHEEDELGIAG